MRLILQTLLFFIVAAISATPTPSPAPEPKKETLNATVGVKALFRNDREEILLVFDQRRQAWEVPGNVHQGQATAKQVIDALALELGLTYSELRLGGLFTYTTRKVERRSFARITWRSFRVTWRARV